MNMTNVQHAMIGEHFGLLEVFLFFDDNTSSIPECTEIFARVKAERAEISPGPLSTPLKLDRCAWAQSSMRVRSYFSQSANGMLVYAHIWPCKCTGMIAFVFLSNPILDFTCINRVEFVDVDKDRFSACQTDDLTG